MFFWFVFGFFWFFGFSRKNCCWLAGWRAGRLAVSGVWLLVLKFECCFRMPSRCPPDHSRNRVSFDNQYKILVIDFPFKSLFSRLSGQSKIKPGKIRKIQYLRLYSNVVSLCLSVSVVSAYLLALEYGFKFLFVPQMKMAPINAPCPCQGPNANARDANGPMPRPMPMAQCQWPRRHVNFSSLLCMCS